MPQQSHNGISKKKKKGRAPAHQNTFAFRHNPKSKKTEKILESPILYCCRRCHDKLEWRKRYRKYKPRTQLGSCNLCNRKVVQSAYHTICPKCTTSEEAWRCFRQAQEKMLMDSGWKEEEIEDVEKEDDEKEDDNNHGEEMYDEKPLEMMPAVSVVGSKRIGVSSLVLPARPQRVCAVCVKEVALPDEGGSEHSVQDIISLMGPMTLRRRRALERQLMRQEQGAELPTRSTEGDVDDASQEDDDHASEEEEEGEEEQEHEQPDDMQKFLDDCDDDDPFLKAIGGAEKLLVGDAYQKMLLSKINEKPSNHGTL